MKISSLITNWYSKHKRDLPWRETKNPYFIWVSEVILQQTRIKQGIHYYNNFINKFPNIFALANTTLDEVMITWQGLGYYSRARNMHSTSKEIAENFNGQFPETFEELKKLKGIGDYTTAAIASFAFNKAVPVVDGNVFRVLARLYGIYESTQLSSGKKIFYQKANELIDIKDPATYNQAIMEFGALQCTPKNPNCSSCPLNLICFAFIHNTISELPLKKAKIKKRNRYFYFIHITYKNHLFIEKRNRNDIWEMLYQFPLIELNEETDIKTILSHPKWIKLFETINYKLNPKLIKKKHILSHQNIFSSFIKIEILNINDYLKNNYIKTTIKDIKNYSIPRLIESYIQQLDK